MLYAFALFAGFLFNVAEALAELLVSLFQSIVGVHTNVNAVGSQSKEQVTVFLFDALRVIGLLQLGKEFFLLLLYFLPGLFSTRPTETYTRRLLVHTIGL